MQLMRQFAALALRPRWWRRVMQFYLPLAVVCLVMTVALYRIERSAAIAQQQRQAGDVMRGIERELDEMINDAATDLVRLASDHDLMQTLLAGSNSNAIRDDFLALLRIKPVYTDLSLVDAQGREQLKVRLRHSVAAVAEPALHERYAGRPLFEQAGNLRRGTVYLSPFALSEARGQLEQPLLPKLLMSTPAFDAAGNRRGIVMLGLSGQYVNERLQRALPPGLELWLLNPAGEWLIGGRREDAFSAQTGIGMRLQQRDAALARAIAAAQPALMRGDGLWVFGETRILQQHAYRAGGVLAVPLQGQPDQLRWSIVLHYDSQALAPALAGSRNLLLLFALGTQLMSLLLALLVALQIERNHERQRAESAFFRLFEHAPVGVMVLDADGHGLYVNRYWQVLSGLSSHASLGLGWRSSLALEAAQVFDQALALAAAGEERHCELCLRHPDGRSSWAALQIARVPADADQPMRYLVGVSDIDAGKRAQARNDASLHLLEGVLSGSSDLILVIDPHYAVTLANPAFKLHFSQLYGDAPAAGTSLLDWLGAHANDRQAMLVQFGTALRGGSSSKRLSLGGARRLFDGVFSPIKGEGGGVAGAVLFARDVTESAHTQAQLVRNEELFRAVFAGSLDMLFVLEAVRGDAGQVLDFRYVELSGPIAMLGNSKEQLIGHLLSECRPFRGELPSIGEVARKVLESGQPWLAEHCFEQPPIEPGWYESRVVSLGWGVMLMVRSITSRKLAEQSLAASEALLRSMLDSSPHMIVATDMAGCITLFNRAAENLLGYRATDLVGKQTPLVFHDPQQIARLAQQLSREHQRLIESGPEIFDCLTATGPDTREWLFVGKKKQVVPVSLTLNARCDDQGRRLGTMGIAYDISAQKALQVQRDRLFAVVEALPDAVGMFSASGKLLYANPAARRLRGIAPEAPLDGLDVRRGYSEWSYHLLRNIAVPQVLAGTPWQGETQWVMPDGSLVDTRQLLVSPAVAGDSEVVIASIAHDLTEIHAMQDKMVEEEALLNSVLESVRDAIVVVDGEGRVIAVNPAVSEVFAYGLHKVIGKPAQQLLAPADGEQAVSLLPGAASQQLIGKRIEVLGQRADGTVFDLELTVSDIQLGQRQLLTAVMRDISARKAFEGCLLKNIEELETLQAALNNANAQLLAANEELAKMAQIDGLTGVGNRRAFDAALALEWERGARSGRSLALLMIDVDHFKPYNDGYGHQAGDACLQQLAGLMRQAAERPADTVARYGGEEFAIILPETDASGAARVGERLRSLLAAAAIEHRFVPAVGKVTVSIGVAVLLPLHGVSAAVLLAAADQALYQAKRAGRDRMVIAA